MSSFTIYKTAIGNLTAAIVRGMIDWFAKQAGAQAFYGSMTHKYSEGVQHVIAGFRTQDLPEGIGVNLDGAGNLIICGDPYGQEKAYAKYKAMLESGVISNGYQIQLNCDTNQVPTVTTVEEDKIVIAVQVEA